MPSDAFTSEGLHGSAGVLDYTAVGRPLAAGRRAYDKPLAVFTALRLLSKRQMHGRTATSRFDPCI